MKTVNQIPITKCFSIAQYGFISSFIRVEETEHDGLNALCLRSTDPAYYKGEYYFIQLDINVIPTIG